jgi:predicted acylesterase/phospholipase RssA/CRP-like cAMP-binding protein
MSVNELFNPTTESSSAKINAGKCVFTQAKENTTFFRLLKGAVSLQIDIGNRLFTVASYSSDKNNDKQWFGELPSNKSRQYSYQLSCTEDSMFECFTWEKLQENEDKAEQLLQAFSHALQAIRHAKALYQCLLKLSPKISTEFLETMLPNCQFNHVEPGQVIFQQGDPGTSAYFLLSGKLGVYVGQNETKVGEVSRGELFGEMAVISGEERSATIIASRYSELAILDTDSFQLLSTQFPQLNQAVINLLMNRLRAQNEKLERQHKPQNRVIISLSRYQSSNQSLMQEIERELSNQDVEMISSQTVINSIGNQNRFEDIAPYRVTALLEAKEATNQLNLLSAYFDEVEWSHHCLKNADEVWLILDATESIETINARIAPFICQPYWRNLTIKLILTHRNTAIKNTEKWLDTMDADDSFHLIINDSKSITRIVRRLQDKANSLVLGGGGAKGFAHIGVMRALEEANIPVDAVGGSSIGAIMSGWVAMGLDTQQMTEAVHRYFVSVNPLGDYTLPIISLSKSRRLDTLLHHSFKERNIEDLPIPFFCMSSDLSTAQEKCHDRGKLWRAVRASLAIPGVITPAIDNGHFLVDGGLLNNLPVDLMNQRSNGPVLAIDVTDINSFDTPLSSIPNAWSIAWKKWITRQQVPIPTILETLVRSTMLASYSKRNDNKRKVDYYIQPDVKEFGILEFTKAAQVIEKGYETGIAIVEDLDKTLTNINNA